MQPWLSPFTMMERIFKWIGFLNDLFYGRSYIAAPAELSISFLLDEKSIVVSQGILSIWIGNHRDIAIFWTFSRAWGNEKLN